MASKNVLLTIAGFSGCGYFIRAANAAKSVANRYDVVNVDVIEKSRNDYKAWLKDITAIHNIQHTSSPLCFIGTPKEGKVIGGCDDTLAYLKKNYPEASF
mmetsp:Transcript_12530/g.18931  ORF Transcript_12530/g.18931 Transcript_12530/m.18931 type:complete len:100 (-) Transcript_12530:40-339(-)